MPAALKKLKKFIPFAKVDETKREVWGIVTAEVRDKDGETCRYAPTKELYRAWSAEFQKATDGESFGNLREMHQLKAAGRGVGVEFHDEDKEIWMGFKVVDSEAWNKVLEKVYTGFSQGGEYVDGPDAQGFYTARPTEVSLVDNPCLGVAHFAFIRSTGAVELIKVRSSALQMANSKTKRVAGEDLPESSFAYVGDPDDTSTWKLPIEFSTDEKTKSHVRNALSRFDQADIPESERVFVRAKIVAAAKKHGIEITEKAAKEPIMNEEQVRALIDEMVSKSGGSFSLAKKATIHGHLQKAMDNHEKLGENLKACMKAMGHESPTEEGEEGEEGEEAEKSIRATLVKAGLTGDALETAVRKATGKPETITKADVASIVGESIGEAFKAVFGKSDTQAKLRQTVIPITKTQDANLAAEIEKLRKENESLKKSNGKQHDPDAALELVKSADRMELSAEEAMRLGLLK